MSRSRAISRSRVRSRRSTARRSPRCASSPRAQGAVAFSSLPGVAVAALAAEAAGRKQMTFSHVAQGNGYWTGLALLSPTGGTAVVELRSADGQIVASKTVTLGDRIVGTLGQLLPVGDVSGGY